MTELTGYFIDTMDGVATVIELVTSWLFVVVVINVPLTSQGHTRKTVTTRSMYVVVRNDGDDDDNDDDNDGFGTGAAEGQER